MTVSGAADRRAGHVRRSDRGLHRAVRDPRGCEQLPGLRRIHGRHPQAREDPPSAAERRSLLVELWEGLRYVTGHRLLFPQALATGSSNFATNVVFADLLRLGVPVSPPHAGPAGPGRSDRGDGLADRLGVGRLAAPTARCERRHHPRHGSRSTRGPADPVRTRGPRGDPVPGPEADDARRLRRRRLQHPAGEPAAGDHARAAAGTDERRRCGSSSGGRSRSARSRAA